MLKGLYFKLHDDNEEENKIIEFFREEAKEKPNEEITVKDLLTIVYYKNKSLINSYTWYNNIFEM